MGMDQNEGMLSQARKKLADQSGVKLVKGELTDLPFPDCDFDGVMCNQVVHHLDPSDDFAKLKPFLAEVHRVLKSDGIFCLNTCSEIQLDQGYWYYDLIPPARERMKNRYMPMEDLIASLRRLGFGYIRRFIPADEVLQRNPQRKRSVCLATGL